MNRPLTRLEALEACFIKGLWVIGYYSDHSKTQPMRYFEIDADDPDHVGLESGFQWMDAYLNIKNMLKPDFVVFANRSIKWELWEPHKEELDPKYVLREMADNQYNIFKDENGIQFRIFDTELEFSLTDCWYSSRLTIREILSKKWYRAE